MFTKNFIAFRTDVAEFDTETCVQVLIVEFDNPTPTREDYLALYQSLMAVHGPTSSWVLYVMEPAPLLDELMSMPALEKANDDDEEEERLIDEW
jgi:hypothetical protein